MDLLSEKLCGRDLVRTGTVTKLNGMKLDSVYVAKEGQEICPTCYFNDLYEFYQDGMALEAIAGMIADMADFIPGDKELKYLQLTDYEQARERICVRLINTDKNREMLEEIPSVPFLDLSVVFYVLFSNGAEQYQTTVTDVLMDEWGKDSRELIKTACENTKRLNPMSVTGLDKMLEDVLPEECRTEGIPDISVVSSETGRFGAVYMLDTSMLARIAERMDDDLFIIPSSVHEVLLVPMSSADREELDRTVKSVNATALSESDYLSDHAYVFLRETGKVTM